MSLSKYETASLGVLIGCVITVGLMYLISIMSGEPQNKIEYITTEQELSVNYLPEFSEENLIQELSFLNVRFPLIIVAQAKLETGNFTSKVFLENNNLFGMKQAVLRPTTCKGTNLNHGYYNNWIESVYDYAFFQAAYLNDLKTEEAYYEYLGKNYATDPDYIKKVKQIAKTLEK